MARIQNFEPGNRWSNPEGTLTERAQGFLRSLMVYIGADTGTTPAITTPSITVTGAFGSNGKEAQTSVTVDSAVSGTAGGTYTAAEQAMINDSAALLNQIRAALIANGTLT